MFTYLISAALLQADWSRIRCIRKEKSGHFSFCHKHQINQCHVIDLWWLLQCVCVCTVFFRYRTHPRHRRESDCNARSVIPNPQSLWSRFRFRGDGGWGFSRWPPLMPPPPKKSTHKNTHIHTFHPTLVTGRGHVCLQAIPMECWTPRMRRMSPRADRRLSMGILIGGLGKALKYLFF